MNGINPHTPNALRRWSTQSNTLPTTGQIKSIHVYDFDNTLFSSPLPSKQLWSGATVGHLQAQEFLHNGGWWHNPAILSAVGQGVEKEELRAWEGCWNETIVELVRLSMQDESALCILLTGRGEDAFSDLLGRMTRSKGLSFDMMCLKPQVGPNGVAFKSTMAFKQALLRDLVFTYTEAEEIRIYEDRPKHVKAFRDFFTDLNKELLSSPTVAPRQPITAEVIHVAEQEAHMDPATEIAEVQRMINTHNTHVLVSEPAPNLVPYKIKRSVFFTGYMISPPDIERLKTLVDLPAKVPDHEMKWLANNVLITPRPAPPSILSKIGGIGAKQTWHITGIGSLEQRIWAARVSPIPANSQIYSENPVPCIVLATRRQTKPIEVSRIQNWQPVSKEWENWHFETVVGEKMLLRIEQEIQGEDEWESAFANQNAVRKHPREDEWPALPSGAKPRPQTRSVSAAWGNKRARGGNAGPRGGAGPARGGPQQWSGAPRGGGPPTGPAYGAGMSTGGGVGSRGRGGGGNMMRGRGRGGYRSLDDNVGQGYGSGSMQY